MKRTTLRQTPALFARLLGLAPRARLAPIAVLAFVAACGDSPSTTPPDQPSEPRLFATPIGGTMNQDWFMTNYVDGEAITGLNDYQCGLKSYPGHKGTDLVLPDFARMDAGVDVVAAAPGTVIGVHDGEFDRNKSWSDTVTWNAVLVDHGEHDGYQYVAWYGHLMNGSVAVAEGQSVTTGTVLGQVGSSGRSDMPHLHFEVARIPPSGGALTTVDPWEGPCGASSSLWLDQIPYQDAFRVIQTGLTTDAMSLDRAKDPPAPATAVDGSGSELVSAWVQLHNQEPGGWVRWTWRRPGGETFQISTHNLTTFYSMSWWWLSVPVANFDEAGTWSVQIQVPSGLVATLPFEVTTPSTQQIAGDELTVRGGGIR